MKFQSIVYVNLPIHLRNHASGTFRNNGIIDTVIALFIRNVINALTAFPTVRYINTVQVLFTFDTWQRLAGLLTLTRFARARFLRRHLV